MTPYKLLLVFPTRERPHRALFLLKKYIDMLEDKDNYTLILNCDIDDITMNNDDIKQVVSNYKNTHIFFNENKTKVEANNINVDKFEWDIVLVISDDLYPIVKGYDNVIRKTMNSSPFNPKTDCLLWLNDGGMPELTTIPSMGRNYYERFGWITCPEYKSVFGDNDAHEIAKLLGNRFIKIDEVILFHKHPSRHREIIYDNLYRKNDSYWNEDERLYEYRKKNNFFLNERIIT